VESRIVSDGDIVGRCAAAPDGSFQLADVHLPVEGCGEPLFQFRTKMVNADEEREGNGCQNQNAQDDSADEQQTAHRKMLPGYRVSFHETDAITVSPTVSASSHGPCRDGPCEKSAVRAVLLRRCGRSAPEVRVLLNDL